MKTINLLGNRAEIMVSSYKKCYDILNGDTNSLIDVVLIPSEA